MRYIFLLLFVAGFSASSFAGKVDTVSIYSNSMHPYINTMKKAPIKSNEQGIVAKKKLTYM